MPDRIYLDDCERFNGTDYFPYHYFDAQWTWMPRTSETWYCYSPKFDTDETQGSASIKIESDIYRVAEGFWPGDPQNGWIMDGTDLDAVVHLYAFEPGGTANFTFLNPIPTDRDWYLNPAMFWHYCAYGDGIGSNNNFYLHSNGITIGIHSRTEAKWLNPNRYYSTITINGVVQDSWYQEGGDSPGASWSYLQKIGNTYSYVIKHEPDTTLATISATVSMSEIGRIEYVGATVNLGYGNISAGYNWSYTKSYGTSYIYKNLYAAGVDQKNFRYCDTLWYSIKANSKESVNSYVKFVIGDSSYDQWEYDITINVNNTWESKSIDITNLPLYVRQNGIRYVGFKYVHDILETEYSDFIFRYDNIHADPSEEYIIEDEDYAFIT